MDIVAALEPFDFITPDGTPRAVPTGQLWRADDPVVVARPRLFGPITVHSSLPSTGPARASETADAAPGNRRARSKAPSSKSED